MLSTLDDSISSVPPLLPASFDRDAAYDAASWRSDDPEFPVDKKSKVEDDDDVVELFYKSGLRGRRIFALWCCVAILFIVTAVNLAMTLSLLAALRLTTRDGIIAEDEIPGLRSVVTFLVPVFLRHLIPQSGPDPSVSSFGNESLTLRSEAVVDVRVPSLRAFDSPVSSLSLVHGLSRIASSQFEVAPSRNATSGLRLGGDDALVRISRGHRKLSARALTASLVSGPTDADLAFKSETGNLTLTGSEGVFVEGSRIAMEAFQGGDIRVVVTRKSEGRSILGGELNLVGPSIFLDPRRLAKASDSGGRRIGEKICVCASNGRLFRLRQPASGCYNLQPVHHPC